MEPENIGFNKEIIDSFLIESEELLGDIERHLLTKESSEEGKGERINALFRAAHTLSSCY